MRNEPKQYRHKKPQESRFLPVMKYKRAVEFYDFPKEAGLGSAEAQYNLGLCYHYGYSGCGFTIKTNLEKARHYYGLAAKQGLAQAKQELAALQYDLGTCYKHGNGVEKDLKAALHNYRLAADQGLAVAQYDLGTCYEDGNGVERDLKEAINLYIEALAGGSEEAANYLSVFKDKRDSESIEIQELIIETLKKKMGKIAVETISDTPQGTERSWRGLLKDLTHLGPNYKKLREVIELYKDILTRNSSAFQAREGYYVRRGSSSHLMSDQKSPQEQFKLGICYKYGKDGIEKDLKKAQRCFSLAAKGKVASAFNELGLCYLHGDGIIKDIKEALRCFRKGAELGSASAQENLVGCYQNGDGVDKDIKKALHYYRQAANQGLDTALRHLDKCYETGDGVEKNPRLIDNQGLAKSQGDPDKYHTQGFWKPADQQRGGEKVNKQLSRLASDPLEKNAPRSIPSIPKGGV